MRWGESVVGRECGEEGVWWGGSEVEWECVGRVVSGWEVNSGIVSSGKGIWSWGRELWGSASPALTTPRQGKEKRNV